MNSDNSWFNQVENDLVKQSVIQRGKITYRVSFIVLGVITVLTGLTLFALIQRQTAITRQLASQGKLIQTEDKTQLQLGTLLAIESLKGGTLQPLDAVQALHEGIGLLPRYISSTISSPGYPPPYEQKGSLLNVFAFTSDSKYIAIAKDDGIVLKEVVSGKEIVRVKYDHKELNAVTLSPDGKYAATVTKDNKITVWDLSNSQTIAHQTYPKKVNNIVLSPNGKYIAVVSENMNREIFEISNNQEFTTVELPPKAQVSKIDAIVFSPDGKYLAEYTRTENTRQVWDLSSNKKIIVQEVPEHDKTTDATPSHERENDMVFSSDGKYFAASVSANAAKVWKLPNAKEKSSESSTIQIMKADFLNDIALSPDGKYLAVGDQGTNIKIMEVASGKEFASMIHSSPSWIGKVVFSPDGKYVASVGRAKDKLARVYEVPNPSLCEESCQLKEVARMVHESDTLNVAFSPNGKYLATEEYRFLESPEKHNVNVWEAISTPEVLRTEVSEGLQDISFERDGLEIVAKTDTEKIIKKIVGDVANGQEEIDVQPRNDEGDFEIKKQEEFVIDDNPKNANSKIVKLRGNKEAKPIELTPYFSRMINKGDLLFEVSPKAKYFGGFLNDSGGDSFLDTSGFIKVWELSKDKNKEVLFTTFSRAVNRIIFSLDEKYLAAVVGDGTARIWDLNVRPPQEIERLQVSDNLQEIAFSPDGKYFVTASKDSRESKGIVQVWLRQPKDLTTEACKRLSRNLTPDEWQQYLGTANPIIDSLFSWVYQIFPTCPKLGISEIEQNGEISRGDKILVPTAINPDKQAGREASAAGDFSTASKHLQASLKSNLNDPEARIYLNNARIGNQKSYTIAVSVPISDINGSLEILRGVAQAQDEFNNWAKTKQGIIPIRVLIADDRNDPKIAQEIAKQLANNPDILGVVGHFSSSVTREAAQVYNDKKLVAISPVSTSVQLSDVLGKYVFRTVPNDKVAAKKLANYTLNSLKKQKVVVFYNSQSEYSCSLASEFTTAFSGEKREQLNGKCSKYRTSYATSQEKRQGQILKEIDLSAPDFDAAKSLEGVDKNNTVLVLLADTSQLNQSFEI